MSKCLFCNSELDNEGREIYLQYCWFECPKCGHYIIEFELSMYMRRGSEITSNQRKAISMILQNDKKHDEVCFARANVYPPKCVENKVKIYTVEKFIEEHKKK